MRRGSELLREQNVILHDGYVNLLLPRPKPLRGTSAAQSPSSRERCDVRADRSSRVQSGTASRPRRNVAQARSINSAAAEEALQSAITVAKRQGARSFELRAALALAKLYQSTGRPSDAYPVLASALEGFRPMAEMPEIAEADALLSRLA
jgi:hypothetical protein